ncbi:DUF4861 family protein [Sunxiuqinia sp. sy24]
MNGWAADQYNAGQTVGLGGVRLWDGQQVVFLNRSANEPHG